MKRLLALTLPLLGFLLACATTGLPAGLFEDEGVTLHIAIGGLDHALGQTAEPMPVTDLYAPFDGRELRTPGDVLANLQQAANPYPPAYYLLLNRWSALFGAGRVALRLLSVLFGVLALLGLERLARRLVPHPGAGFAILALAALSPWLAAISCFARPYAMVVAVSTWSTVAAVAVADDPRRRGPRAAFVLLSLLGLYTLYHYAFVLAWQGCFLLASLRSAAPGTRRRATLVLLLTGAVIVLGFLPWVPFLRGHLALADSMQSYYVGPPLDDAGPSLWRLLTSFLVGEVVGGTPRVWLDRGVAALLVATVALLAFGGRRKPDAPDPVGRALLLTAPLYPLAILIADLQHGFRTLMISKTSFLLFPLLLLLLVRVWLALRSRAARAACLLAGLALLVAATVLTAYASRAVLVDDRRLVAEDLARVDAEPHVLLLDTGLRSHAIPLLMALQDAGVRRLRVVAAPPAALTEVLARMLARPDVLRLTLVNLHVDFDPRKMWSDAQLTAAAEQARGAGWSARRVRPEKLAELFTQDARVLRIIDPVR